MGSSPTRGSSFFLGKVTALGVLCCFALFVCLTLLASFFLPSHLSFKDMYTRIATCTCTCILEGLCMRASRIQYTESFLSVLHRGFHLFFNGAQASEYLESNLGHYSLLTRCVKYTDLNTPKAGTVHTFT